MPSLIGFHPTDDRLVAVYLVGGASFCTGNGHVSDTRNALRRWRKQAIGATGVSLILCARTLPATQDLDAIANQAGLPIETFGVITPDNTYTPYENGGYLDALPIPEPPAPRANIASNADITVELSTINDQAAAISSELSSRAGRTTKSHRHTIERWLTRISNGEVMRPVNTPTAQDVADLLETLRLNPRLNRWKKTDTPVSRLMTAVATSTDDTLPAAITWLHFAHVRTPRAMNTPVAPALAAAYYIAGDTRRAKFVLAHTQPSRPTRLLEALTGVGGGWEAPPGRVRVLLAGLH